MAATKRASVCRAPSCLAINHSVPAPFFPPSLHEAGGTRAAKNHFVDFVSSPVVLFIAARTYLRRLRWRNTKEPFPPLSPRRGSRLVKPGSAKGGQTPRFLTGPVSSHGLRDADASVAGALLACGCPRRRTRVPPRRPLITSSPFLLRRTFSSKTHFLSRRYDPTRLPLLVSTSQRGKTRRGSLIGHGSGISGFGSAWILPSPGLLGLNRKLIGNVETEAKVMPQLGTGVAHKGVLTTRYARQTTAKRQPRGEEYTKNQRVWPEGPDVTRI